MSMKKYIKANDVQDLLTLPIELIGEYIHELDGIWIDDDETEFGQWIPCSERLPKVEGKMVLVTYKCHDFITASNSVMVSIGWNKEGRWHCCNELYVKDENVLAWMPLPEPYMKGEQL